MFHRTDRSRAAHALAEHRADVARYWVARRTVAAPPACAEWRRERLAGWRVATLAAGRESRAYARAAAAGTVTTRPPAVW